MKHDNDLRFATRTACVAGAVIVLAACAENRPPEVSHSTPLRPHRSRVVERVLPPVIPETRSSLQVDDEIVRLCNLPTAHFAFDSADIAGDAAEALDALASCMEGPLKGKALDIVGHADPRGPVDYNFALGQKRAGSVAMYLLHRGIDDERVVTSSMGELDATGTDEQSWASDRKVEISVAKLDVEPEESPYSQLELQRR